MVGFMSHIVDKENSNNNKKIKKLIKVYLCTTLGNLPVIW